MAGRRFYFLFLAVFLLTYCTAFASEQSYGNLPCDEVTSIYDGDTFKCDIKGVPPLFGERIGVRIYGIDCPEMKDNRPKIKALAQQAKQFTVAKLRAAKKVELRNVRRDKYFRVLAEVYVDGQSLADQLLKAGLAKPYDGGKKAKWN